MSVRTEMTGMQQILILHICDSDQRDWKVIPADGNLLKVCSTDEGKSESIILVEISTEESESERVHKSINKNSEKCEIDET